MAADPHSSAVTADNPLVYYRLNETSGSTANDSSGNGQNAQYQNVSAYGVTGPLISAADTGIRTGGVGLTNAGTTLPSGSNARTVDLWINMTCFLGR